MRRRHLRTGARKFASFDLSKSMEERVKERYREVHGNGIQADLEATKKLSRGMIMRGRRMLPQLRELMVGNGIDLEKADRDITWDEALERVMINQRSRALVGWCEKRTIVSARIG